MKDDALLPVALRVLDIVGERDELARYLPQGPLFPKDEVEVHLPTGVERGVVEGWIEDEVPARYAVWIPATDELEICDEDALVRVGRSLQRRSGPAMSTRVMEAGEVTGTEEYVVLEDVMDLIADASPPVDG